MKHVWVVPLLLFAACKEEQKNVDPVVARVGDEVILRSEAERGVAMEIHRRRVDIHSLVKNEVERLVEARLLEREAKRRGVTVEALLAEEVGGADVVVDEREVDAYLAERGLGEDRRARARNYLEGRARIEKRIAFLETLSKKEGAKIDLPPPEMPRIDVDVEGAPQRGPADAAVTIVHFGSLTSPRSKEVAQAIAEHRLRHPTKIREVFRFALAPRDELGLRAALIARHAHAKGGFWDVHDALFSHTGVPGPADLDALSETAGAADSTGIVALREELDVARRSGVTAPPVVFVNGRWFQHSFGLAALNRLIEDELSR